MKWDDTNIQFGNILRKTRETRSLTQEEFAALCGISRAYYGRVERGEHSITLELCKRIADSLGITLSALFEDMI